MNDRLLWQQRAATTEAAVLERYVRRLLGLPGTALGIVSRPAFPPDRLFVRWNLWWQAHLLDCAVDAWLRSPDPRRARTVARIARTIRLRNFGRYTNDYFDDMAWIGLALGRAAAAGSGRRLASAPVTAILDAWDPPVGGIPWRRGDDFYNAPANAPAAILLARNGFVRRATRMTDWIDANLRTPGGLIADGFHPGEILQPVFFTYNQGAVLGAEVELAVPGGDRTRIHRLVAAVAAVLTSDGVLVSHSAGGDAALFTGILARYLAQVCLRLPGTDAADEDARRAAAELVMTSAAASWKRIQDTRAEGDLSAWLTDWMLLEAAALLARAD